MIAANQFKLTNDSRRFAHEDACRLSEIAGKQTDRITVIIDLGLAEDATTSAFARLVLLRRELLRSGRDLRLTGLRDRVAGLYEIIRLASVLPVC